MAADDDVSTPQTGEHQTQKTSISEDTSTCRDVMNRKTRRRVRVLPPAKRDLATAAGPCHVVDAAVYLVTIAGSMSRGKLQDLLYFGQAWHLVWDNELLFPDPIISTEDGVRIEAVEELTAEAFTVTAKQLRTGQPGRLTDSQERTLVSVIKFYGSRNHYRLSEEIRDSAPWQQARASGDAAIEPAALLRHYRQA